MTTFAEDETSPESSQPIELYTFTVNAATYRYTSYADDVTHDDAVYLAIPKERSGVAVAGKLSQSEITINVDASCAMMLAITAGGLPPQTWVVEIARLQEESEDVETVYRADVSAYTIEGRIAKLRAVSLVDEPLDVEVPGVWCQGLCNHVLYDARCGVDRADHLVTTEIAGISGRSITVDSLGHPDDWASGGEIRNLTTGDRRMVLSQIGDELVLDAPFMVTAALGVGNTVEITQACDHRPETCRQTFDNIVNFGGHPHMRFGRKANPFAYGLDAGD